jgi:regulator of nucleoside diphosphate kinase
MRTSESRICLCEFDLECLRAFVFRMQVRFGVKSEDLMQLQETLDFAEVVDTRNLAPDIVTLDSEVRLRDVDFGRELHYTVVLPLHANIAAHKISILAPLGMAMLGHRVGDDFEVQTPFGIRTFCIEEVLFQPEHAGRC